MAPALRKIQSLSVRLNLNQDAIESLSPGCKQFGDFDWTGCDLVESAPAKVSGRPVFKGTRILASTIIEDAFLGSSIEEIAANDPSISIDTIRALIAFANAKQLLPLERPVRLLCEHRWA